jgi:hypothetical protein
MVMDVTMSCFHGGEALLAIVQRLHPMLLYHGDTQAKSMGLCCVLIC